MNLPNILTVLRILLTIGFIFFALENQLSSWIIAAGLFTLASLTDYLDGYLARKYNLNTDFGKIMDPIADKFLTLSAFFIFIKINLIPDWMFYVVAAREILVTISRLYAMKKGKVIAAEKEGKLKTVIQMAVVFLALGFLITYSAIADPTVLQRQGTMFWWFCLIRVVMLAAVGLTVFSGLKYFWNNRQNF